MATTNVTVPGPGEIQLQVQVEQQINNSGLQPAPGAAVPGHAEESPDNNIEEIPEQIEEDTLEDESTTKDNTTRLPCVAFVIVLLLFLWPFVLVLINYYTDYKLWQFIKSTHDSYDSAYDLITSDSTNISILTCSWDGTNSLDEFQSFLLQNDTLSVTECQCEYITANAQCDTLNDKQWTTTNFDYDYCSNEATSNDECLQCTECTADSVFDSKSPHYLYSLEMYQSLGSDSDKEGYCSPNEMKENVKDDRIDGYYTHCANACIVFVVISGLWICCGFCAGCKVRYKDVYRTYLWCFKGKEPPKRSKYHRDDAINQDEFTLYVLSILFLHIFEDVTQCIIAIMFSIYKQNKGGSDCIEQWSTTSYSDSVELVPYSGGTSVWGVMFNDDEVALFFTFAFLSVFCSGIYGVRLLGFDIQKTLLYPWWKNMMYAVSGFFMGILFILLILTPFWSAVYLRRDDLYLMDGEEAFLGWTCIIGLGGYIVAICMPLCFAEQLDCNCDCGDGCC